MKSTVTLEYKKEVHRFKGLVESASKLCIGQRNVVIYKDKPGIDPVVGEPKTGDDGRYLFAPKRVEGRYFATVEESKAGKYGRLITCGAAQSKVIRIT